MSESLHNLGSRIIRCSSALSIALDPETARHQRGLLLLYKCFDAPIDDLEGVFCSGGVEVMFDQIFLKNDD